MWSKAWRLMKINMLFTPLIGIIFITTILADFRRENKYCDRFCREKGLCRVAWYRFSVSLLIRQRIFSGTALKVFPIPRKLYGLLSLPLCSLFLIAIMHRFLTFHKKHWFCRLVLSLFCGSHRFNFIIRNCVYGNDKK